MRLVRLLLPVQWALVWSSEALALRTSNCSSITNVEIEYTLNLFAYLVDTHNYTSLDMVFTSDAMANFATPIGAIVGRPMIEQYLQEELGRIISQHALSTHIIRTLETDCGRATAITYLQGTFFGQGNATGQYMTTFGL